MLTLGLDWVEKLSEKSLRFGSMLLYKILVNNHP